MMMILNIPHISSDFLFCFVYMQPYPLTDRVGTIYTMAPQVLQGVYSSQADLWAVGVIAYMLLSTSKPFWSKRRRVVSFDNVCAVQNCAIVMRCVI